MGKRFIRLLKGLLDELLDIIYPLDEKCVYCGAESFLICKRCEGKIARCFDDSKILSYGYYNDVLKKIILDFKYKNNFACGKILSNYLYKLVVDNEICADGIFYIPLSKQKLKDRGFNQCEIIAKSLSERLNIPLYKDIIKVKDTKEQKKLTKDDRHKNIQGAFAVLRDKNIRGKSIILIDDVVTTGATLFECEKVLKENGASKIKLLTVAKTYI